MKIIVTGGGTAGHVIPLLAVASEYKHVHPQAIIRYVGGYNDKFARLATESSAINKRSRVLSGKFRRYHGVSKKLYFRHPSIMLRNIFDLLMLFLGIIQSLWLLIWWRPRAVFVKGGYVGFPVGLAATVLRVPIVTHDSDAVPGLTNRVLARFAKFTAVAMPPEYYNYPKSKVRYTGLPVREVFHKVKPSDISVARQELGIPNESFVVTVIGGSLGAARLNEAVLSVAPNFMSSDKNRWLLHQTGGYHFDTIMDGYNKLPVAERGRIKVWDFIDNIQLITTAADIIISRAGSSIHELSVQQKPLILVPNPMLAGAHQTKNAQLLSERGAAIVISQAELDNTDNTVLLRTLEYLIEHPQQREQLAEVLGKLAITDASARIVKVLDEASA